MNKKYTQTYIASCAFGQFSIVIRRYKFITNKFIIDSFGKRWAYKYCNPNCNQYVKLVKVCNK